MNVLRDFNAEGYVTLRAIKEVNDESNKRREEPKRFLETPRILYLEHQLSATETNYCGKNNFDGNENRRMLNGNSLIIYVKLY